MQTTGISSAFLSHPHFARLAGSAVEFTDLRLTSAQNEAARALVRRFMDALDGQVRYR